MAILVEEILIKLFFTLNTAKHDMMKNTLKVIDCKKTHGGFRGKKSANGFSVQCWWILRQRVILYEDPS